MRTKTQSFGKRHLLAILMALALTFAFVGVASAFGGNTVKASADEQTKQVTFETVIEGAATRYVDSTSIQNETVVVKYRITENTGVDSILLIPSFNADVFQISGVSVNEETSLGTATITEGSGVKKILLEHVGHTFNGVDDNSYFLTVTYTIKSATAGNYSFGLVLDGTGDNNRSVAYLIEEVNGQKGEQTEVAIDVVTVSLTLIAKQDAVITFGRNTSANVDYEYSFEYNKTGPAVVKVDSLYSEQTYNGYTVEYTYSGDAAENDIAVSWYIYDYYDNAAHQGEEVAGGAPISAGTYFVVVSASETSAYHAVEASAVVRIYPKSVTIYVDNKQSAYGDDIVALTYTTSVAPYEGDSFGTFSLYTEATEYSNVGTYLISCIHNGGMVGSYDISVSNAYYTITKKQLTLTALDQTTTYNGSAFSPDQSRYTLKDGNNNDFSAPASVMITTGAAQYINAGFYQNVLVPSIGLSLDNYDITVVYGNLTINTAGVETQIIQGYFTGLTVTYNGSSQNLLQVDANFPEYYDYVATGATGTNAGEYVISITVTADSNHHFNNDESQLITSVTGTINKAAVTFIADNKSKAYGEAVAELTYQQSGTIYNNEITVNLSSSVAADSNVGNYDIVVSASNSNYEITLNNGTYTVTKGTPVITLTANGVYYNRGLDVTATANVNTINGLSVITAYYSDSACTQEVTPVNAGIYYVKAAVADTANYNAAEATASFEIKAVKLAGVTFDYDHGNVSWTAVANDIGKTDSEEGVEALALKEGTTIEYKVYNGETLIGTYNNRSFVATAATTYKVIAVASDDNYIASESVMVPAYEVLFDEGEHTQNPTGTVSNMPDAQYIFAGETAVAPSATPAVDGCTFSVWKVNNVTYTFTDAVNGDITIVAVWNEITYTITLKYLTSSETLSFDMFTLTKTYGETVDYSSLNVTPVKGSNDAGIYYTFANKWIDENNIEYAAVNNAIQGYTVTRDMTFVAVFDEEYNSYTITYYFSENGSDEYTQFGDAQTVVYKDTIDYRAYTGADYAWFIKDYWYGNENRTTGVPAIMPAANINVYGTYKFIIGAGDVNADGTVTTDDITLYRQWIVGGYQMTVVPAGTEWALVTGGEYNANTTYFLPRVADINVDSSKDIRDVSITRMALVGGYDWDLINNDSAVARTKTAVSYEALVSGLANGRARMYADLTNADGDVSVNAIGNVYLDLGGNTLTVKSLSIGTSGFDATVTIKNGTIVTTDGVALVAPNGNVVIEDVTAYDENGIINLQAADSSLHFAGDVSFYKGGVSSEEEASITVAEGTHVVVEIGATLVVEKIQVATVADNVFTVDPSKSITFVNNSATDVIVEGEVNFEIKNLKELKEFRDSVNAGNTYAGTVVKLMADITLDNGWKPIGEGSRAVTAGTPSDGQGKYFSGTFDGNGHTISGLNNTNYVPTAYATDSTGANYVYGLFGLVNNATIKNLTLTNVNINTLQSVTVGDNLNAVGDSVAALVGYAGGDLTVENVTVSGTISAGDSVAGIVGRIYAVTAAQNGTAVISITNCVNNATIAAGTSSSAKAAGIVGFVANKDSSIEATVSNNINTGSVSSGLYAAGVVLYGKNSGTAYKDTTARFTISNNNNSGTVTAAANKAFAVLGCASLAATNLTAENNTIGAGTQASPYLIYTLSDLKDFRDSVNAGNTYAGKYIKLMADITLDNGWKPIGEGSRKVVNNGTQSAQYTGNAFAGIFDGNGKTISNLNNIGFVPTATADGQYAYGLFALTDTGAEIRNLTLTNVDIDTSRYVGAEGDSVGALVGFSAGSLTVENVTVSGSVKAVDAVGGIVGRAYDQNGYTGNETFIVSNCVNNATIAAGSASSNKAAGIVGFAGEAPHASINSVTISGCTNNGVISGSMIAGIAVYSYQSGNTAADDSLQNYSFSGNTDTSSAANKYRTANGNVIHANETIVIDD